MRVSLKVDVEDLAGYQEGLPALLKLFDQYQLQASFLFSLGYDNTGLRLKNLFNPRILTQQLPVKQKLYGTLLPPLSLSKKFGSMIKSCADAGHEVGIKSFDSVAWQFNAIDADLEWTQRSLKWSIEAFADITGFQPEIHSACGFVINNYLLELEQELGFKLGLHTRGKTAYLPEYHGVTTDIMQLPVTLPAIEELLLDEEVNLSNVHEYLFVESQKQPPQGHVYQVRAAYEGRRWLDILEKIIVMWRSSQWEFNRVSEAAGQIDKDSLLIHQVGWAQYQPHSHFMATQGLPVGKASAVSKQ